MSIQTSRPTPYQRLHLIGILITSLFLSQAQAKTKSLWQFHAEVEPYIHNYEWFSPIDAEGFTLFGIIAPTYIYTQLNEQFTLELGSTLHFAHQSPSHVNFLPYIRNTIQLSEQHYLAAGNIEQEIHLSQAIKYDIQRYLGKPANGIAYQVNTQQQQFNLWFNWLDIEQVEQAEQFEAGLHYQIWPFQSRTWTFTQQAFTLHQGGQKTNSVNSIRSFWSNSQLEFQTGQHKIQLGFLVSDYQSNITAHQQGAALNSLYSWQITPHQQLTASHFASKDYLSLGEHPGYQAASFQQIQWAFIWPLSQNSQLNSRLSFQWINGEFASSQHLTIKQHF